MNDKIGVWGNLNITDFGYVLRHSKNLRVHNVPDLVSLKDVKIYMSNTSPKLLLFIPYGSHKCFLEHNGFSYQYPYILISERPLDCRMLVFKDVSKLMGFVHELSNSNNPDIVMRDFVYDMRLIRIRSNSGKVFVANSTSPHINIDSLGWMELDEQTPLSSIIFGGVDEDSPIFKRGLDDIFSKSVINDGHIVGWKGDEKPSKKRKKKKGNNADGTNG